MIVKWRLYVARNLINLFLKITSEGEWWHRVLVVKVFEKKATTDTEGPKHWRCYWKTLPNLFVWFGRGLPLAIYDQLGLVHHLIRVRWNEDEAMFLKVFLINKTWACPYLYLALRYKVERTRIVVFKPQGASSARLGTITSSTRGSLERSC